MNRRKKLLMSLLILSLTAIPTSVFAEDTSTPVDLGLPDVNVVHQETQEVSVDKLAGILDVAQDAIAEERGAGVSFARSSDQKPMITLHLMINIRIFMKRRLMKSRNLLL